MKFLYIFLIFFNFFSLISCKKTRFIEKKLSFLDRYIKILSEIEYNKKYISKQCHEPCISGSCFYTGCDGQDCLGGMCLYKEGKNLQCSGKK